MGLARSQAAPRAAFPPGFLWGSATSAHQVEGDNFGNDWWLWEQLPGKIRDGTRSGRAAEWWSGRAEEDLARAAALGQTAHRLSIEWSRFEPEVGAWHDGAVDGYRSILTAARSLGLKTVVTLHHFTLPGWLSRRGSWLAPEAPSSFARFAERAVQSLGDVVDLWATHNEPNVLAYMAYAGARWPPGSNSVSAAQRALVALLESHAIAYRRMKASRPDSRVGIVLNAPAFDPARPGHVADRAVAAVQDWAFGGEVLHALEGGWLLPPASIPPRRIAGLARSFDWLGVNYYGRYRVAFDARQPRELFGRRLSDRSTRTPWTDWGEPFAPGLARVLGRLSRFGVPLYVTENGLMDAEDRARPGFLLDHLRATQDAMSAGVDVRGYFHWSLVDNFEWAEGWSAHFGLHRLDRSTQARTLTDSGRLYSRICREGALPEHDALDPVGAAANA